MPVSELVTFNTRWVSVYNTQAYILYMCIYLYMCTKWIMMLFCTVKFVYSPVSVLSCHTLVLTHSRTGRCVVWAAQVTLTQFEQLHASSIISPSLEQAASHCYLFSAAVQQTRYLLLTLPCGLISIFSAVDTTRCFIVQAFHGAQQLRQPGCVFILLYRCGSK